MRSLFRWLFSGREAHREADSSTEERRELSSPFSALCEMASLSAAAALLLSSLEEAERPDGSSFLRLSSSAPSWGSSVIREAHLGELPNDSRYELIRDALSLLSDNCLPDAEEAEEAIPTFSMDLLPVATCDLLQWFAAHANRLSDCDEALENGRVSGGSDFSSYDLLSEGFRLSAEETLSSLISSLEEERETLFNPDTDCRFLLSDSHGIYIPQLWAQSLSEKDCDDFSVSWEDVKLCQSGPDEPLYWEAWQSILDNAEYKEDREMWRLIQNGDLFAVRAGAEIPEEWFC